MAKEEAIVEARRLARAARSGTLATVQEGQPFASLVTPCPAPDLSPLLWLSSLSAHSRHLRAEPRCALMLEGAATGRNPQTTPRVTLLAEAAPVPAEAATEFKQRFIARHPYASLYADFADFTLWRLSITGAHLVGGFARAFRLRAADLLPAPQDVAAVAALEAGVRDHVNAEHRDALALIAAQLCPQAAALPADGWRLAALDVDGCDIAQGETVLRLAFAAPVRDAVGIRAALVRATQDAREQAK